MPFNNKKLNSVRLYGKYINLSKIHTAIRPIIEKNMKSSTRPEVHNLLQ